MADFSLLSMDSPPRLGERSAQRARRKFIQKVYSILAISGTVTLVNVLFTLVFMSQFLEAESSDILSCIIFLAIGLTFSLCGAITYLSLSDHRDFTVHRLFIYVLELIWLFTFFFMWTFPVLNDLLFLGTFMGFIIMMMALAVNTQMVFGGLTHEYPLEQYLVAAFSLYWNVVVIFLVLLPCIGWLIYIIYGLMDGFEV